VQKNLLRYLHSFRRWPNLCKYKQAKHKIKLCKHSTLVDGCSLLILLAQLPPLAKPVQAQASHAQNKTVQAQRAGGWVFVAAGHRWSLLKRREI
jgi:hypothetical protein